LASLPRSLPNSHPQALRHGLTPDCAPDERADAFTLLGQPGAGGAAFEVLANFAPARVVEFSADV